MLLVNRPTVFFRGKGTSINTQAQAGILDTDCFSYIRKASKIATSLYSFASY